MSSKQFSSDKFDLQLNLSDGQIKAHRKMELLPDGAWLFEDILEIKGSGAKTFVMCDAWLLEFLELESGEFSYVRSGENVRPNAKRFGAFYPPFTIIRACFKDVSGRWRGMASTVALPAEFATVPFIFDTDFAERPNSIAKLIEMLSASYNRQSVEMNPAPSLLSLKAKRLIDENYLIQPSIARVAARLGVTHEHLTRQFKRDFGMTPSAYLRNIRIADATFKLAKGEEIISVSQEVGYNDLSRFYKQFRKTTTKTPGYCQAPKKRIALKK